MEFDWNEWKGRLTPCSESSVLTAFSEAEKIDFELASETEDIDNGRKEEKEQLLNGRVDNKGGSMGRLNRKGDMRSLEVTRRKPGRPRAGSSNTNSILNSKKIQALEALFDDPNIILSSRRHTDHNSSTVISSPRNTSDSERWGRSADGFSNSVNVIGVADFHRAAQYGQVATMEKMLEKSQADLECKDTDLNTALHVAALHGQGEIVKLLLRRGANTKAENLLKEIPADLAKTPELRELIKYFKEASTSQTSHPLLQACWKGKKRETRTWLQSGANINNIRDSQDNTGLHYCAIWNRSELAEVLLKEGDADVNYANIMGNTALHEACRFSSPETVKILLRYGAEYKQTNKNGDNPIVLSIKNIRKIFRAFAKENKIEDPDLFDATSTRRYIEVSADESGSHVSLEEDVERRKHGLTREERKLQQMLAIFGRTSSDSISVEKKKRGRPPKSRTSEMEIVSDEDLEGGLLKKKRRKESVSTLSKNTSSRKRLFMANENPKLDPSFIDKASGRTQLHKYAMRGKRELIEKLLEISPRLAKIRDNGGYLPLHEACLNGHLGVVNLLIKAYPNGVNCAAENGDTPLHDAAGNDVLDIVKVLLENGADKERENKDGLTPLDVANDSNTELRNLLSPSSSSIVSSVARKPKKKTIVEGKFESSQQSRPNANAKRIIVESGLENFLDGGPGPAIKARSSSTPGVNSTMKEIITTEPLLQLHYSPVDGEGNWYFMASQLEELFSHSFFPRRLRDSIPLSKTRILTHDNIFRLAHSSLVAKISGLRQYLTPDVQSLPLFEKDAVLRAFERAGGNLANAPIIYVDFQKLQQRISTDVPPLLDPTSPVEDAGNPSAAPLTSQSNSTLPPKLKMKYWQAKRSSIES